MPEKHEPTVSLRGTLRLPFGTRGPINPVIGSGTVGVFAEVALMVHARALLRVKVLAILARLAGWAFTVHVDARVDRAPIECVLNGVMAENELLAHAATKIARLSGLSRLIVRRPSLALGDLSICGGTSVRST